MCIVTLLFSRDWHDTVNPLHFNLKGASLVVKNMPVMQETQVQPLSWEDLENRIATPSSILAWRIPWTEEPGVLQSMRSQRVGHD